LANNNAAIFAHRFDWGGTIASTYNLSIYRLAALDKRTGCIQGILPLVLFAPPGKEKRLISLPYTDAAGIIARG